MTAAQFFALLYTQMALVTIALTFLTAIDSTTRALLYGLFVLCTLGTLANVWDATREFDRSLKDTSTDA
jgi:uncharacterized membrane protein YqjE